MKRTNRGGWASTDQPLKVAIPTPEPVELEGPWEARTVMGKKGAGTGHPSLLPPTLPSLASTSRWPEPAPGSQQAGRAGRCSLQGRPVCRVRAGGRHWGLRDSGEPSERTQPGTTPRDPQGPPRTREDSCNPAGILCAKAVDVQKSSTGRARKREHRK